MDRVPPRVDKVLIPADVTPENVTTSITDYSSKVQGWLLNSMFMPLYPRHHYGILHIKG